MEKITRKQAKSLGFKRYFTGNPCPKGHICERRVANFACTMCKTSKEERRCFYERHRARLIAKATARKRNNPEAQRIRYKRWVEKDGNREKVREQGRARRAKNRQRENQVRNAWKKRNSHKIKIINARRNATKKAPGSFSTSDIKIMLVSQRDKCYWCLKDLNGKYHVDHFIPIAHGGNSAIENIVVSCPGCNLQKLDKMPWEFCAAPFARLSLIQELFDDRLENVGPLGS